MAGRVEEGESRDQLLRERGGRGVGGAEERGGVGLGKTGLASMEALRSRRLLEGKVYITSDYPALFF